MSLRNLQSLWRAALPDAVRSRAAPMLREGVRVLAHASRRASVEPQATWPIRLVGLFDRDNGIAASARLAKRAFEAVGARVEVVSVAPGLDSGARLPGATTGLWIFHLNAPEMTSAIVSLGPRRVVGPRYGYWAWELPRAPSTWLTDAALVDEVWAPSRYTAAALKGARAPVRVVPHPLFLEDYRGVAPAPKTADFRAVTVFDCNSSAARKNPEGAVEAFRRAFGDDPSCELIIKTQNGEAHPTAMARLHAAAGPHVRIIDAVWPYAEVKRLIAGADVLISLHRAEGFGLTMAEAMALGVPVVATAATGNLDFMGPGCAVMVPASWVPVEDPDGIYKGQVWAEPDLTAAAESLRRLRSDPDMRARLADAGRARVAERLSPTAWLASLPPQVQAAVGRAQAEPGGAEDQAARKM